MVRRPPLGENAGLRGGDRGGAHARPIDAGEKIVDDVVVLGGDTHDWRRREYIDVNGQKRVQLTR